MALLILALLQRIFLMSSLMLLLVWLIFFMVLIKLLPILGTISGIFFQAEDGIRVRDVTGLQTCALPISSYLAAVRTKTGEILWRVRRPRENTFGAPIVAEVSGRPQLLLGGAGKVVSYDPASGAELWSDRKSTRLNSSHITISYAVFCLKK